MSRSSKRFSTPLPRDESLLIISPAATQWYLLLFILLLSFIPGSHGIPQNGIILGGSAVFLLLSQPAARIHPVIWIGTGLFLLLGLASFLPSSLFPAPEWRSKLDEIGVKTGDQIAIQPKLAIEQYSLIAASIITAILIIGHRVTGTQAKKLTLAFSIGAAIWTISAILLEDRLHSINRGYFGFFPNRNHTGTFLSVAIVCSLGVLLQAIRDRSWKILIIVTPCIFILLWGVAGISISRAGIILTLIGTISWLAILGPRYWSSGQRKAMALIILLAGGSFLIGSTKVRERLVETWEKISSSSTLAPVSTSDTTTESIDQIDFRIPIARDTFNLISDFPITGIGPGEFRYIFPQYRYYSSGRTENEILHPESDWLWIASEFGIPATLCLITAIFTAYFVGLRSVLKGRNRAVRAACLAASALVAIHGCFDVPGHRPALLLLSAFLLMLALSPESGGAEGKNTAKRWLLRLPGIAILAISIRFIGVSWFKLPTPATYHARQTLDEGAISYDAIISGRSIKKLSDIRNQRTALLEKAESAIKASPLDSQLYLLSAAASFPFEHMETRTENRFAIQRALKPHSVTTPAQQAEFYLPNRNRQISELWTIAIKRAERIDAVDPSSNAEKRLFQSIRHRFRKQPSILKLLDEVISRSADSSMKSHTNDTSPR